MNRIIDFKQPSRRATPYETPQLALEYIDNRKLVIAPKDLDSGNRLLLIPFTTPDGLLYPVRFDEWTIDLDAAKQNFMSKTGGRMDNLALAASTRYHIWAFADQWLQPQGFGVTAEPLSAFSRSGTNAKGSIATLTGITKAYRFARGMKVRVIHVYGTAPQYTDAEWNLGTVWSIESSTSIKVVLDNSSNYGTTLSTTGAGVSVAALDRAQPFKPDDPNQAVWYPFHRLIGMVETDASSNITRIYESPIQDYRFTQNIELLNYSALGSSSLALSGATHLYKHIHPFAKRARFLLRTEDTDGSGAAMNLYYTANDYEVVSDTIKSTNAWSEGTAQLTASAVMQVYYWGYTTAKNHRVYLKGWGV